MIAQLEAERASPLKMVGAGLLILWAPVLFVWYVKSPEYPKPFLIAARTWAGIWITSAVLYLLIGMYVGAHGGRAL